MYLAQSLVLPTRPGRDELYVEGGAATSTGGGTLRIPAGTSRAFATYFNAFPVAYWVRWTDTTQVRLHMETSGVGQVKIVGTDARGESRVLETHAAEDSLDIDLDVAGMSDGGWLWFEIDARDDVDLHDAQWLVDAAPVRDGGVRLSITTMDKPDFLVDTLNSLAEAPGLAEAGIDVQVIDQGSRRASEHPGFAAPAAKLADRLTLIEQPNFGGSGGFARGMLETLDAPGADAVVLLDDDVQVEPEGILRAVRFHRAVTEPAIVGGHMLDLNHPTVLHAFSEVVDQRHFMWGSPERDRERHDLATGPMRATPWLHARAESDFNGWWMCLIPVDVLRRVGLSMPFFLKWDDAEFGLRAQEAGVPTVALPGFALWHVSWLDKDDTVEWQAYLHVRNRAATALLHSRRPRGGALLRDLLATDLKFLLSMRYYAVALHVAAIEELLAGPDTLHENLGTVVRTIRERGAAFGETTRHQPDDDVMRRAPRPDDVAAGPADRPTGGDLIRFTLKALARQGFARSRAQEPAPSATLRREQATWWHLPWYESVLVLSADEQVGTWLRRDRRTFWRLLRRTVSAHLRLALRWDRVAGDWRNATGHVASPEAWRTTLKS